MAVLVSDSFNRANSTTTLGTTDSYAGGTATTWTYQSGTWGITNNQAYLVAGGAGHDAAVVQTNQANVQIDVDLIWLAGATQGIGFRSIDNNNIWTCRLAPTQVELWKTVGSTSTSMGTYTFTPVNGTTYHMTVIANGNSITVTFAGTQIFNITDSALNTATLHGLRNSTGNGYYDNFKISDLNTGSTGTTLNVSLSDSVSTSDVISQKSPSKRLSDSIISTDTIWKQTTKNVSDSFSISDSIFRQSSKSVNDSISVTDNLSRQPNITKTDSITLSDSISKRLTVTVLDSISLADSSNASQGGKSASLSDTVLVTDAIVKKVISSFKQDVVSTADGDYDRITKTLLDSITLTDSITKSNGKSIILTDTITVTDAISKAVNVLKNDSIALADTVYKTTQVGIYDVLITSDDLTVSNSNTPELIGSVQLKGSRVLNIYLVGSQSLSVNLKGSQILSVNLKGDGLMAETHQDFEMYQRTNFDLIVPITNLDLTGCTITWALRQRMKSTENLVVKTTPNDITINGDTLTVHLVPSDTDSLVGSFYHECKMTDTNGKKSELFTGNATILFSNL